MCKPTRKSDKLIAENETVEKKAEQKYTVALAMNTSFQDNIKHNLNIFSVNHQ